MDQTSFPSDADLYEFTIDDVPFAVQQWLWTDATHLNIAVSPTSVPLEVFCVRLKEPDPLLLDVHGHECLGWSQLCDTFNPAFAPTWDENGKVIES